MSSRPGSRSPSAELSCPQPSILRTPLWCRTSGGSLYGGSVEGLLLQAVCPKYSQEMETLLGLPVQERSLVICKPRYWIEWTLSTLSLLFAVGVGHSAFSEVQSGFFFFGGVQMEVVPWTPPFQSDDLIPAVGFLLPLRWARPQWCHQ